MKGEKKDEEEEELDQEYLNSGDTLVWLRTVSAASLN